MTRPQSFTLPAAIFGCLIIAWIGTIAVAKLPAKLTLLAPGASQQAQLNPADQVKGNIQSAPAGGSGDSGTCSLGASFPGSIRQWCNLIMFYAGKNRLAPDLVAAVILQESGGNPQAYSVDGAVGLMQVMPSDGLAASFQCPSGPCFTRRPTTAQLLDPEFNISFGTSMLAGLIQKYNSIRDGLKYYGPSGIGYDYADKVLAIWENYP
jgi:soluble lytic murein transglycosylase-like protein